VETWEQTQMSVTTESADKALKVKVN
jgi:hypothetical protein